MKLYTTALLMPLACAAAFSLRGDTVELKTGERIEGTFKQATSAGAVIEVGGQSISIPLEKLRAIYFGAVGRTVVGPPPCASAGADSPQVPVPSAPPADVVGRGPFPFYGVVPMTNPKPVEKTPNVIVVKALSPVLTSGVGNGVYSIGGEVTAPHVIYKIDPEYTEEARKANYSGTMVLYVEVDKDGHSQNVRVLKGIGLGLDEKAIEAVNKWRFEPGLKDGKPVVVRAQIEVSFRLMRAPHHLEYRVTGTASGASLTYRNETGGTEQLKVKLPWSLPFDTVSGRILYLAAQKQGRGGTIRSEILVDSVSYQHAESTSSYGIASVNGVVP